jgi:hypothetical protein
LAQWVSSLSTHYFQGSFRADDVIGVLFTSGSQLTHRYERFECESRKIEMADKNVKKWRLIVGQISYLDRLLSNEIFISKLSRLPYLGV